jgi:hypothetical protein
MSRDGISYSYDAHLGRVVGRQVRNQNARPDRPDLVPYGAGMTDSDAAAIGIDMTDAMTHEQAVERWGADYRKDAAMGDDITPAPWEYDD